MPHKVVLILSGLLCIQGSTWAQQTSHNHLVPIPAYQPDGYDQAVFNALLGQGLPQLSMVCKPSFSPEYALILRSELVNPNTKGLYSPTEPRRWILESVTATKHIWHWKSNLDGSEDIDILKDVPVERKSLVIDASLANALQQAWECVLRQTRYPEKDEHSGLDGVSYLFYCQYDLFGQTWSPKTGLPADLVILSEHLIKLVQSTPESQRPLAKECLAAAQRIEDAAKTTKSK